MNMDFALTAADSCGFISGICRESGFYFSMF
jgi:hypothetical protein